MVEMESVVVLVVIVMMVTGWLLLYAVGIYVVLQALYLTNYLF